MSEEMKYIEVDKYNHDSNDPYIFLFLNVFENELIPTYGVENTNQFIESIAKNLIFSNKLDYYYSVVKNIRFILFGFGNKFIHKSIDEYEFHLYLLSFFDRYGKLFTHLLYSDKKIDYTISISFKSLDKDHLLEFKYLDVDANTQHIHLEMLLAIKSITFLILNYLVENNIKIEDIKHERNS